MLGKNLAVHPFLNSTFCELPLLLLANDLNYIKPKTHPPARHHNGLYIHLAVVLDHLGWLDDK